MTITAIAKDLGTSTMTIYRRLKRAGINVDELRDADTGELTALGASTIASLFPQHTITADENGTEQSITDDETGDATASNDGSGGGITSAAVQVAALTATVDGLRALVAQLEGERDELRRQLATVTAALQAEQADRQHERLLLTGSTASQTAAGDGGDDQRRRGWLWRLFHD